MGSVSVVDRQSFAPRRARCAAHGLVVGPDGRCVLCRRDSGAPPRGEPGRTRWLMPTLLSAVAAGGVAGALSWALLRDPEREPPARNVSAARTGNALAREPSAAAPRGLMAQRPPPAPARPAPVAPFPGTAGPSPASGFSAKPPVPAGSALPTRQLRRSQVQALLRTVPITLYTTASCPHCSRARQWLRSNAIPFVERDIEKDPANRRAMRALNPRGGVPTIDVDGQILVGFNDRRVGAAIAKSVNRRLKAR